MKINFWAAGLTAFAMLISGATQAALVTLTFSNGSTPVSIFTMDSDAILAEQNAVFSSGRIALASAEYTGGGSSVAFDTTNAYYGQDINFETVEFRAGSGGDTLQLSSVPGGNANFTFDATTNAVTFSGSYPDPVAGFGFINFSFSGTDFLVDLTTFDPAGLSGFVNTASLNTSYTVDTLRVSVSAVPLPAAVWLFGTGLIGLLSISRRRMK